MSDVDARPEADRDVANMFNVETSNATHHDMMTQWLILRREKKATQSKAGGYHC